ncbi:M20/M25/M40 family metallo-hydrolase [Bryobacter aggregatus]|uniref:M20/M25/M40 family metallo-hydrolase n=1 Tax=Bryobacter aggregatus TaxID=360054 RepID=UPI0004E22F1B|nr:M20/M25/M40 family metallo-hydrolase [Bryobacter aggregatus]
MFRGTTLLLFLASLSLFGQKTLFDPSIAQKPELKKAFAEVEARKDAIWKEWITLTEIPSPSNQEKLRIAYMKSAMARIGLTDIQQDEIGNVWGTYKGSGGGPVVAFAAHTDTVFPMDTPIHVKEINGRFHAPGIGDDTGSLAALINAFDIMKSSGIKTKGDVIFVATVQEEIGLLGAKHWLEHIAKKPDMFVAVDSRLGGVGYGALLIEQYKFIFEGPTLHTLASKGKANAARGAARAILAIGEMKMPEPKEGGSPNLPVANVGTLGGGTVVNATPGSVYITVDIRSQDIQAEQKLVEDVKGIAQRAANQENLHLKIESINVVHDYSKALPKEVRLHHPLVQSTLAVTDYLKLNGEKKAVAFDSGSDDHNIGVAMGIPSIGIGAILGGGAHSLEESADKASILPGTKYLILLASTLAGVN